VLYSKSHAYLISQNYGSSCSSFNGSSVATRSLASRFFSRATRARARSVIASRRSGGKIHKSPDERASLASFAKIKKRGRREKREREREEKRVEREAARKKEETARIAADDSDPGAESAPLQSSVPFQGEIPPAFLRTTYRRGFPVHSTEKTELSPRSFIGRLGEAAVRQIELRGSARAM